MGAIHALNAWLVGLGGKFMGLLLAMAIVLSELYLVWRFVSESIEGDRSWVEAFAVTLGLLVADAAIVTFWLRAPVVSVALGGIIVSAAVLYGVLSNLQREWLLSRMEAEEIAELEETIRQHPELPYPYIRLGDIFYRKRMWEQAVAAYTEALKIRDDRQVRRRLEHAQEELRREREGVRECPICRIEVDRSLATCPSCGRYLPGAPLLNPEDRMRIAALICFGVAGALLFLAALAAAVRAFGLTAAAGGPGLACVAAGWLLLRWAAGLAAERRQVTLPPKAPGAGDEAET